MTTIDERTEAAQPTTLPELLRLLGAQDKAVAKQFDAILVWLGKNQPNRELWMSLVANGYGIHLEQNARTFKRPCPYRRITTGSGTKASLLL
jgi:hypothetical protein